MNIVDMLQLPSTDLLLEILKRVKTRDAVYFLSTCQGLHQFSHLLFRRIRKSRLNYHLHNTIFQKQQHYSGIIGRCRMWQMYLPHKYELPIKTFEEAQKNTYYYFSFSVKNPLNFIPLRGDIIHKIVFTKMYDKVELRYNHKTILGLSHVRHLVLNIPTNKLLKNKVLYINMFDKGEYIKEASFEIFYRKLDDIRKREIEKDGCVEINIESIRLIITTDGLLINPCL